MNSSIVNGGEQILGAQQFDNVTVLDRNISINYKMEGNNEHSLFRLETSL